MTSENNVYNLITVLGPTAGGKTAFAAHLANQINGEIISADSRQVYRRMNLGTGKDYADYIVNDNKIPVHLVDIHEPGYKYNVYEFQKDFITAYNTIISLSKTPVLCGGSGLYINAAIKGYTLIHVPPNESLRKELEQKTLKELADILASFKKLHNTTDIDTKKRTIRAIEIEQYYKDHARPKMVYPEIKNCIIGIQYDRDTRRKRITERLHQRLEQGMVEEVQNLIGEGVKPEVLIYYGLEYKYITEYLAGNLDYKDMVNKLTIAIHQFAKRQMTWFRKMEKEGTVIHWLDGLMPMEQKTETVLQLLKNNI
ncbi:MAG: tRNA (adenosine(37)-N6)-dimethylallyltransferase MiaA [Bacteroidales bacterium]|nr:tRNA (adenosine(37)-N6)-dimethylallyltransferase MiaA [Bacteroidales bacterium]